MPFECREPHRPASHCRPSHVLQNPTVRQNRLQPRSSHLEAPFNITCLIKTRTSRSGCFGRYLTVLAFLHHAKIAQGVKVASHSCLVARHNEPTAYDFEKLSWLLLGSLGTLSPRPLRHLSNGVFKEVRLAESHILRGAQLRRCIFDDAGVVSR
jgi:hypothetical protein